MFLMGSVVSQAESETLSETQTKQETHTNYKYRLCNTLMVGHHHWLEGWPR